MKFFRRSKDKKGATSGSAPPQRAKGNPPAASQLTGNRMGSLNDIDTVYTSPQQQQQQQKRQHAMPPQQVMTQQQSQQQQRTVRTSVNPDGRRVVTTTVRVPAQQQQQQPPPPQQQQQQLSPLLAAAQRQAALPPVQQALPPRAPAPATASEEDSVTAVTRELVKKFIADIWNRGETDLIPEVCSPSLRFNGNTGFDRVGHDGLARMVGTIRDALDDYHCEIHSMVVENNKAFCRLRFTGKHTGNLLGFEATNKVVAWMGATEFTVQNGKILKVWELGDVRGLEAQITDEES